MCKKLSAIVIFFLTFYTTQAQDDLTSYQTLPLELTKNANAVVRLDETLVRVESIDEMEISIKRIVTVLNENGLNKIEAVAFYDNNTRVKDIEARIYNKSGKQIKKIREKDFQDVSAVDGGTMYSDSRVKYLDYTPIEYPFTAVFTSTIQKKSTASIPRFAPIRYYTGIQKYRFKVTYPLSVSLYKKELNLEEFNVIKDEKEGSMTYILENVPGIKPESYSPSDAKIEPQVFMVLSKFNYEGVAGEMKNWEETGKWIHQYLLQGRATVDEATKATIKNLVANATSDREKAKRIYEYMQNKTRYISVQVGIGGLQPIPADEVDRVGYGDCKGLTNYMMALLKIAGIESYYTVVQAGNEIVDFHEDFASLAQGNHIILNIPNGGDDIWLECTSQKSPFGHIGDFTDDRNVLVVTPEGGQLKHTKKYATEENLQETTGMYTLDANGNIKATATIITKGIQYDRRFYVADLSEVEKDKHYKKYFNTVNNVNIDAIKLNNDKEAVEFSENVQFNADAYGVITGDRMLFAANAFNRKTSVPNRYRNRKFPLEIQRGYYDVDTYDIKLPEGYTIEAMPSDVSYETKFGSYSFSITKKDEQTLQYKRTIKIQDGLYPKEEYKNYRKFIKKIVKYDGSKIVLIKK
jgi:transglutaminase-like putative cysteine protease